VVLGIIKRLKGKPAWDAEEAVDPLSGVPQGDSEEWFSNIIAQLEVARDRAKQVYYKMTNELEKLHARFHDAVMRKDRDSAELIAAEIVVKKRHLKVLLAYTKLLEAAITRINNTRDLTNVAKIFASMNVVMKSMEGYMYDFPELLAQMAQFATATQNVISQTSLVSKSLPMPASISELDPEVKRMIATAFEEAEKETRNLVPSIPEPLTIDYGELEKKLLDYIKANGGVLNVKRAAQYLGVSPRIVKEVLYRLEKKGVVRITGGPAREAGYA